VILLGANSALYIHDSRCQWLSVVERVSGQPFNEYIHQNIFKPLGAVGSIVVFYNAIYAWMSDRSQIWGKLQATMFALVCLGVLWLVFAGHLLSFNSNY
jgi:hypothetical protein